MGMPVIIDIPNFSDKPTFKKVFKYFKYIDEKFSPFKQNSEVTKINDKRLRKNKASEDMKKILDLSQKTKKETSGYFEITKNGFINPSGIVKGWAIWETSKILDKSGCKNYCVEAGGDIQTKGRNEKGENWAIGIRNPFNKTQNVKIVNLNGQGIATSGIYERGNHIYNPNGNLDDSVISLTVIGPNIYEADRFATAAFAMGRDGINFIESQNALEGYMIDVKGIATMSSGFEKYVK